MSPGFFRVGGDSRLSLGAAISVWLPRAQQIVCRRVRCSGKMSANPFFIHAVLSAEAVNTAVFSREEQLSCANGQPIKYGKGVEFVLGQLLAVDSGNGP